MTHPLILVESITKASLSNGIVRLQCLRTNSDGQQTESAELLIPANRAGAVAQSLVKALRDIERQMADQAQSAAVPN
jgi:hypothetical protein